MNTIEILKSQINKKIELYCRGNIKYIGILSGFDIYSNILLDDITLNNKKIKKSIINGSSVIYLTY